MRTTLGQAVRSFFEDYLPVQKGLRSASIRSYRDAVRLFLNFVSADRGRPITRLHMEDLTMERTLAFLKHLEQGRGNHIRTRNQRLAALRTFFTYLATRAPEMLHTAHQVMAIPTKRVSPPETQFLEREEIGSLLKRLPRQGRHALRDRTLMLVLYNTGARAQEVAELRVEHLDLGSQPCARLHGKGDRWRTCPLWTETARHLRIAVGADRPVLSRIGAGFLLSSGRSSHSLRHLQDRPQARRFPGSDWRAAETRHASPVPSHRRRTPAEGWRRSQRHPGLAGPRAARNHEPLRPAHLAHKARGHAGMRATFGYFDGTPP